MFNDWILSINGKKEIMPAYTTAARKIQDYINEHLDIDKKSGIPSFINDVCSKGNKIKLKKVFEAILNQDINTSRRYDIFERTENSDGEEVIIYYHLVGNEMELYLKNGESYLFTNFFYQNEASVVYFNYRFRKPNIGAFKVIDTIDITLASIKTNEAIEELKKEAALGCGYVFLDEEEIFCGRNLAAIISGFLPYNLIYQFAYQYYIGFKNTCMFASPKDLKKALLLFKLCREQIKCENDSDNYLFIKCSYLMSKCYLELLGKKEEVITLKEGALVKNNKNICAYTLGNYCSNEEYKDYLDKKDKESYFIKAGILGYFNLGEIYFLNEQFEKAINYYEKSPDEIRFAFLSLCYYMVGEYEKADKQTFYARMSEQTSECAAFATDITITLLFLKGMGDLEYSNVSAYLYYARNELDDIHNPEYRKLYDPLFFEAVNGLINSKDRNDDIPFGLLYSCYDEGIGVKQDKRKAFEIINEVYTRGTDDIDLLEQLRELYLKGIGTAPNPEKAQEVADYIESIISAMDEGEQ